MALLEHTANYTDHVPRGFKVNMIFKDRLEAGQLLVARLKEMGIKNPFVMGIPRGGIIAASEIAKELKAPLDVVISRKLGLPSQPELGFGAIAPGGIMVLNEEIVKLAKIDPETIEKVRKEEDIEIKRRMSAYRDNLPAPDLLGKSVILVDDGIATGITANATIKYLKGLKPKEIILAAPVASTEAAKDLKGLVDSTVFLDIPDNFYAVGQFYLDFPQTTDEEVTNILREYNNLSK